MAQNNKPNKSGRRPLVDEEVDLIFRKLEPYLKKGLSLNKACLNFTIKDKIVASYQLNQPFDRFIKEAKIPSSRGDRNWTCCFSLPKRAFYR